MHLPLGKPRLSSCKFLDFRGCGNELSKIDISRPQSVFNFPSVATEFLRESPIVTLNFTVAAPADAAITLATPVNSGWVDSMFITSAGTRSWKKGSMHTALENQRNKTSSDQLCYWPDVDQ
jgi:hypothetical protein